MEYNKESDICLFGTKEECCGCAACMNVCPKQAICMHEDENGFVYPGIDYTKCIQCGMCKTICAYQNPTEMMFPQRAYAGYNEDKESIMKSASGGLFAVLATSVINHGGVVVGAAYVNHENLLSVSHIVVENIEDLEKLQGSKYVQSNIENCYKDIKAYLEQERIVLFSGTPCQIDATKRFLGKKYDNFYTVDIICHGVPAQKTWRIYLDWLSKKTKKNIEKFNFRDKNAGWENFEILINNGDGKKKTSCVNISCKESAFYQDFLDANIYRENCYSCKYAQNYRVGDITIGDYWGIRKVHPEFMCMKNWISISKMGISCVLVNSEKGQVLIDDFSDGFCKCDTTIENVFKYNGQLNSPSVRPVKREQCLAAYLNGYEYIQREFEKKLGKKKYIYRIKRVIPYGIKENMRRIIVFLGKCGVLK